LVDEMLNNVVVVGATVPRTADRDEAGQGRGGVHWTLVR